MEAASQLDQARSLKRKLVKAHLDGPEYQSDLAYRYSRTQAGWMKRPGLSRAVRHP